MDEYKTWYRQVLSADVTFQFETTKYTRIHTSHTSRNATLSTHEMYEASVAEQGRLLHNRATPCKVKRKEKIGRGGEDLHDVAVLLSLHT